MSKVFSSSVLSEKHQTYKSNKIRMFYTEALAFRMVYEIELRISIVSLSACIQCFLKTLRITYGLGEESLKKGRCLSEKTGETKT